MMNHLELCVLFCVTGGDDPLGFDTITEAIAELRLPEKVTSQFTSLDMNPKDVEAYFISIFRHYFEEFPTYAKHSSQLSRYAGLGVSSGNTDKLKHFLPDVLQNTPDQMAQALERMESEAKLATLKKTIQRKLKFYTRSSVILGSINSLVTTIDRANEILERLNGASSDSEEFERDESYDQRICRPNRKRSHIKGFHFPSRQCFYAQIFRERG